MDPKLAAFSEHGSTRSEHIQQWLAHQAMREGGLSVVGRHDGSYNPLRSRDPSRSGSGNLYSLFINSTVLVNVFRVMYSFLLPGCSSRPSPGVSKDLLVKRRPQTGPKRVLRVGELLR